MCGILGLTSSINENEFRVALDTLTHRGPDSSGVWSNGNEITLGHRRLAILDLTSSAAQPMTERHGRYHIVYNGEIYNFLELRDELISLGEKFETRSDTEVLLLGYRRWGQRLFDKLNGMWALAIWDDLEKSLFLSRDRFGKKPLYYSFSRFGFVFASEMKAITPFLDTVATSSNFGWAKNNVLDYESTEHCLIEGIFRFPAGHHAVYKQKDLTFFRYWNTLDNLVEVPSSYADQVDEFRELFFDATRIRMRSDVQIGTALSGGLDSSATFSACWHILGKASQFKSTKDLEALAFVASFPGSDIDEVNYATQVANRVGSSAKVLEIDPISEIGRLADQMYLLEELYFTNPLPMFALYRNIRENGVKVTLDGHGADELLCGYRGSLFHAFPEASWRQRADLLYTYKHSFAGGPKAKEKRNLSYPALSAYGAYSLLKHYVGLNRKSRDVEHTNYNKLNSLTKHLYQLSHETILPTLLRNYDRFSMASGVEVRMPFMDHRLVCYALSLPHSSLVSNGYTKKIVRDSLSPLLPREIAYRRSKVGFGSPMTDWIRGPLREFFGDVLNSCEFRNCDLVEVTTVKNCFDAIWNSEAKGFHLGEEAWSAITPFFWWKGLQKHVRF